MRIPVVDPDHKPLMPTKPARVRKWLKLGKAIKRWSDCGQFYVQLVNKPCGYETQDVVIGIDPGKLYSGVAVQSAKETLYTAHLNLPFKLVRKRMEQRAMLRNNRRYRRINSKVDFYLRAHRQERFSNRRKSKLPPSIRANRQLELRIVKELCLIYPVSCIVYEYVKVDTDLKSGRKGARIGKSFSPVMVGQRWMLKQLEVFATVKIIFGYQTSTLRERLNLTKNKADKSKQEFNTHAVDGVAIACSHFIEYRKFHKDGVSGGDWFGNVGVTKASFFIIKRLPCVRRQLHYMVPSKNGVRKKHGGLTSSFGLRKGDLIKSPKGIFYFSGNTKHIAYISDFNWKRVGQISVDKISLIRRSNGLLVT